MITISRMVAVAVFFIGLVIFLFRHPEYTSELPKKKRH